MKECLHPVCGCRPHDQQWPVAFGLAIRRFDRRCRVIDTMRRAVVGGSFNAYDAIHELALMALEAEPL